MPYSEASDLIPLAENFAKEAGYPGEFNRDSFLDFCTALMAMGRILVAEKDGKIVGALGFFVNPDPFTGVLTASEVFWFVDAKNRNSKIGRELFDAFELTAMTMGVEKLVMVALDNSESHKLKTFYESAGYKPVEQSFWKVLRQPSKEIE